MPLLHVGSARGRGAVFQCESFALISEYRIHHLRKTLGHLYDFEAFLGSGAFAAVFLVRNRKLERQEALKVLRESYDGDHEFAKRFVTEAKLVASLDHPNIVKIYDYGDAEGVLWYSMQYIPGTSLHAEFQFRPRFSHQEVVSLAVPLLGALTNSHDSGIIHRDVKPGNVMISGRGRPYLMDFGIAKMKDSVLETQTGSVLGTPAYVSPEQASGLPVDGRSDVYALGTCLYQLLTGYLPFPEKDPIRMLLRRLHEDPVPPSQVSRNVHPKLETIIMRSLERQVEKRYQSAQEMRQALLESFRQDVEVVAVSLAVALAPPTPIDRDSIAAADIGSETATIISPIDGKAASAARPWLPWGALAGMGLMLLLALWWGRGHLADSSPPAIVVDDAPLAIQHRAGDGEGPAPLSQETTQVVPAAEAVDGQPPESEAKGPGEAAQEVASVPPSPAPQGAAPPGAGGRDEPAPAAAAPPLVRRAVVAPVILRSTSFSPDTVVPASCAGQEVVLTVQIDATGRMVAHRALVSPASRCTAAAATLASSYTFKPGLDYEDEPVTAALTLSIRFPDEPTRED